MIHETLARAGITTVTGEAFDVSVIEEQAPIVVEFMSYGCAHCRTLEPILQDVAGQLASSTRIFRVNVALDGDLADRYDIQATPTLLMFANGREVARAEGPHPTVASIITTITRAFQSTSGDQ